MLAVVWLEVKCSRLRPTSLFFILSISICRAPGPRSTSSLSVDEVNCRYDDLVVVFSYGSGSLATRWLWFWLVAVYDVGIFIDVVHQKLG